MTYRVALGADPQRTSSESPTMKDEEDDVELTQEERLRLQEIQAERSKNYDAICAHVAETLGYSTDPATLSDELRQQITEEADELIENWEEADCDDWNKTAFPKPGLQQLLAKAYELQLRVYEIYDNHDHLGEDGASTE